MSSYGIQDKFIGNTDIKLKLFHSKMLENTEIDVNGEAENYKSHTDSIMKPSEMLARMKAKSVPLKIYTTAKPFRWVTRDGWYLNIHYDWKADHLTM